jgi:hypothetical protein
MIIIGVYDSSIVDAISEWDIGAPGASLLNTPMVSDIYVQTVDNQT